MNTKYFRPVRGGQITLNNLLKSESYQQKNFFILKNRIKFEVTNNAESQFRVPSFVERGSWNLIPESSMLYDSVMKINRLPYKPKKKVKKKKK